MSGFQEKQHGSDIRILLFFWWRVTEGKAEVNRNNQLKKHNIKKQEILCSSLKIQEIP
jgi:hypothetical protein